MSDLKTMAASPAMQAGSYATSPWFQLWVFGLEQLFPGIAPYIEKAAALLPWDKLAQAVSLAFKDWQAGADFFTILTDILKTLGADVAPVVTPTVP